MGISDEANFFDLGTNEQGNRRTKEMLKRVGSSVVLGMLLAILLMSEKAIAEGDSKAGAKFFKSLRCASCHGKDGKGQGPAAKAMKIKSSDWTDKAAMEMLKDDFLNDIIGKGVKAVSKSKRMPAYTNKLKPADIKDLVAYIRSFAK